MKKRGILRVLSIVVILCMICTQNVSALSEIFDFNNNDGTKKSAEEFIQPGKIDLNFNNEYKKSPLLRLPVVSNAPEEEIEGELIGVSEYSKIYKLTDKKYKTVYTSLPITYKDDKGIQHEIDNTLVKNGDNFENKANSLKVSLPTEITDGKFISVSNKGIDLKLIPMEGDFKNAAVKKNAILYNDVFDGIDYQYTVNEVSVKEDIVLNKYVEKNVFKYAIESSNLSFKYEDEVIKAYKNGETEPCMILSAPVMSDAAGKISEKISISLDKSTGKNIVTVTADKDWIADTARAFPIRIDPTAIILKDKITVTTTSSYQGTNQGKSYGYAGYITKKMIGMENDPTAYDFGRTRMYFQINDNFSSIPKGAEIKKANLVLWQYTNYTNHATTFYSYQLTNPWNPNTINWDNSNSIGRNKTGESVAGLGRHDFDITGTVNDWIKGVIPNYGLMLKTEPESDKVFGEAFYTPLSSANNPGQEDYNIDKAPKLEIEWYIPGDVPDRDINDTSINIRPLTESNINGKLQFKGIFADGIAKPGSNISYGLNDTSKGFSDVTKAGVNFAYPNSEAFDSYFTNCNKYRYKTSNWQTRPFTDFDYNVLYNFTASAQKDGVSGKTVNSENFIAYKVKRFDTLFNVANYYGVNVGQLMSDNRVQDCMLVENNVLFIRKPQKNATVPYNPAPLSDADKRAIDGSLMGRGLHCEFGFEPINLNTGNFYLTAEDISIPDYNGNFNVERTYNSKGASYNSMFGRGWNFTYDEKLSKLEDGSLVYSRNDGSSLVFSLNGNGQYVCPEGYHLNLTKKQTGTQKYTYGTEEVSIPIYEYTITGADKVSKVFNTYGQITKVTDAKGFVTSINYDQSNNISSVVSPAGAKYTFAVNAQGKISSVGLPNGKSLYYGYDSNENLVSYTDANGNTITYQYDGNHQMTSWCDANNTKIIDNVYDSEGRVTLQKDAEGNVTTLEYSQGKTKTIDANGNVTSYYYDNSYRTTKIENADGTVTSKEYDSNNNLASETNELGNKTSYSYDANGNITAITRFDGSSKSYVYNSLNLLTQTTDFDGKITKYDYDANGNLTKITNNDNSFVSYIYNSDNQLISQTDANGNVTTYEYAGAWCSASVNAKGERTQYQYNAHGQLCSTIDSKGNITRLMYDAAGRKTGQQNANGELEQYVYNAGGLCTAIIDPKGYRTDFEYSKNDKITKIIDPLEHVYTYTYDKLGNKLSESDPAGKTVKYEYDSRSRLTKTTNADNGLTEYNYDAAGNIVKTINPDGKASLLSYDYRFNKVSSTTDTVGNKTSVNYNSTGLVDNIVYADNSKDEYKYDDINRLKEYIQKSGLITQYTYDANGNIVKTSDNAGRETSFKYDALNNLIEKQLPDGGVIKYEYDTFGNLVKVTDVLGNISTYKYDNANRVTEFTNANNITTKYSYDKNGNMLSQTDGNGKVSSFAYDALNRLVIATNPLKVAQKTAYDLSGNISSVENALGAVTKYEYNGTGKPIQTIDGEGNIYKMSYDSNGNNTEIIAPDGSKTAMTYDGNQRLVKKVLASGLETNYEYDSLNRIAKETNNAGQSTKYEYDKAGNVISMTDSKDRKTAYEYDVTGNLTKVTAFDGNITSYQYDKMGHVISITDPEGKTTTYSYDLNGNLLSKQDDDLRQWQYTYDKIGQLLSASDPTKATTQYKYDNMGKVLSETDAAGKTITSLYNEIGMPVETTDKNGNKTNYEYDVLGRVIKQKAADGGVSEYLYDKNNRLVKLKDPLENVTTYSYNSVGNMVSSITPNGGENKYEYNAMGQQTASIDPLGNKTQYAYDILGQLTNKTLANGAQYSYAYDVLGRIAKTTAPVGKSLEYTYDEKGNLEKQTNQSGTEINYEYDKMHRLIGTTNAKGYKTAYSYDSRGNLASIVNPKGAKVTYSYDLLDRISKETDPLSSTKDYKYDIEGNIESITKNGGRITSYTYDANGNMTSATNPLGYVKNFQYDSMNRLVSETNEASEQTKYGYDFNGHITSITDLNGSVTKLKYDGNGNVTERINSKNEKTSYKYDLADRLTSVTDNIGVETSYVYDSVGNLSSKTNGNGNTTNYTYDLAGNLTSTTNPLNQVEKLAYDVDGNLESVTKPDGKTIKYSYNKLDELVIKNLNDNDEGLVLYAYDETGKVVSMKDSVGKTKYEYDALGRISKVTQPDGNTISYTYDSYGNLSSLTYPDGKSVKYEYDAMDRLTKITDRQNEVTEYVYDKKGNLTQTLRPNGTKTITEYTSLNQVSKLTNYEKWGRVISNFEYTYDSLGNIVKEVIDQDYTRVENEYTYNGRGELETVKETHNGTSKYVKYLYDANGNRIQMDETINNNMLSTQYKYDTSDRLKSIDSNSRFNQVYTYDANGNLKKVDTNGSKVVEYNYTIENRLKAVRGNGRLLMAALYDGNGDRVFTIELEDFGCHNHNAMNYDNDYNSSLTYQGGANNDSELPSSIHETDSNFEGYVDGLLQDSYKSKPDQVYIPNNYSADWNGQYKATSYVNDVNCEYTRVLAENTTSSNDKQVYTYGNGLNSAEIAWEKDYYDFDGRGSVADLTSQYGHNMVSYKYDEFGNQRESGWANFNSNGYSGESYSYMTGLQYLRARYYDPATGRFISQDSVLGELTNPLTQNLYTYCGNNPLNLVDPSGHGWNLFKGIKKAASFVAGYVVSTVEDVCTNVLTVVDTVNTSVNSLAGTSWSTDNAKSFSDAWQEKEENILNNNKFFNKVIDQEAYYTGKVTANYVDTALTMAKTALEMAVVTTAGFAAAGITTVGSDGVLIAGGVAIGVETLALDAMILANGMNQVNNIKYNMQSNKAKLEQIKKERCEKTTDKAKDNIEPKVDVPAPGDKSSTAVNNMSEFFETNYGKSLKNKLNKTSQQYQGQSVYQVVEKSDNQYLKKGDKLYLDGLHKDHFEVFDNRGNAKAVLNLDGTLNVSKTESVLKESRKLQ